MIGSNLREYPNLTQFVRNEARAMRRTSSHSSRSDMEICAACAYIYVMAGAGWHRNEPALSA